MAIFNSYVKLPEGIGILSEYNYDIIMIITIIIVS